MANKLIPAPSSLGGGMMPSYRHDPKAGLCTVPKCSAPMDGYCNFKLLNGSGKTCGARICSKHTKDGMCPSHQRMVEARGQL